LKDTRKCVESRQLHIEDYLYENRVELEENIGVQSISSMSGKEEDSGYTNSIEPPYTEQYVRYTVV